MMVWLDDTAKLHGRQRATFADETPRQREVSRLSTKHRGPSDDVQAKRRVTVDLEVGGWRRIS